MPEENNIEEQIPDTGGPITTESYFGGEDPPEYSDEDRDRDDKEVESRGNDIINAYTEMVNIAGELKEEQLIEIGDLVVTEYDIDKLSRKQWEEDTANWQRLAKMTIKKKEFPWPDAANIMYPTIAQAAVQFAARAYPAIINDNNIVKSRIVGKDEDGKKAERGQRISEHMSYQFSETMEYWEEETDQLLQYFAITGLAYRKTYRNKIENRNESVFVTGYDLVVNYWAPSLERASRVTHVYEYYPNEIEEMKRSGAFLDIDLDDSGADEDMEPGTTGKTRHDSTDVERPHRLLEQHRWLDLDGDGYKEPYIVTVHHSDKKVLRITTRFDVDDIIRDDKNKIIKINPVQYFTKFTFIPSFDKSYYPIGFGALLGPGNEVINATLNQLLDSGTKTNTGGGFIDGRLGLKGGIYAFRPGEYKTVNAKADDLRKMIVPLPVTQPSLVTFNLLDLMIKAQEKLSSVSDLMTGQQPSANIPATTSMMTIEQGLKMFTAIYKRIHRSLKSEFKKYRRLNRLYLEDDEYYVVTDDVKSITRKDYDVEDCDIVPASNPNDVTDVMRLFATQALQDMYDKYPGSMNEEEVVARSLEALHVPDPEKIKRPKEEEPPDPQLEIEAKRLEIEWMRVEIEKNKTDAEIVKMKADSIKSLADAESKESGSQVAEYKAVVEAIAAEGGNGGGNTDNDSGSVGSVGKQQRNTVAAT